MANTLRFKRGLATGIPNGALGEPLFTTDTFDLYIGNGTTNTRFQKYIASGTTSQLLRGDGSLLTMPIVLTSPANGQVLKYNGTSWVNDSDAGITGSGSAGQVAFFTGATTQSGGNNLFFDATNSRLGIGTNLPTTRLYVTSQGANSTFDSGVATDARIEFRRAGTRIGYINWDSGVVTLQADSGNYLGLNAGGSERARITSGGNFIINNPSTDTGQRLQVTGDGYFSGSVTAIGSINVGSVGSLSINAGSAATPLITQTTNYTEIYRRSGGVGIYLGGTGDAANYYDNTAHYFRTSGGGFTRMTLDASGNLGLGVVPSAWNTSYKAIDIGNVFSLMGASNAADLYGNLFLNTSGQYIYKTTAAGTAYSMAGGQHRWYVVASGTAGNTATLTANMTLGNNGNLLLGSTSDTGERLQVSGTMRVSGASTFNGAINTTSIITSNTYTTAGSIATPVFSDTFNLGNSGNLCKIQYGNEFNSTNGSYLRFIVNSASGPLTPVNALTLFPSGAATFSSSVTAQSEFAYYFQRTSGTPSDLYSWSANSVSAYLYNHTTSSVLTSFFEDGNVGIGTTTNATYKLDVNGTMRVSGAATFSSTVTGASFIPTSSTIPTNGMYLPSTNSLGFATNGSLDMTINSRGDIGIGVTPSTWSLGKSIEINSAGQGITSLQLGDTFVMNGVYYNTSQLRYANSTYAISLYRQFRGQHSWYYAPQGTIGNQVTFDVPMTLETTGNLLLGSTTDDTVNRLQVTGSGKFSSSVTSTQFNLSALNTAPATSSSTGTLGEIRIDADHIYVCTATNTWKRVAISTF